MSYQPTGYQQQLLYRADPNQFSTYRAVRDHLNNLCGAYTNRYVRIETMDGQVVAGRIRGCQGGLLYLSVSNQGDQRAFLSPSDELILTLVLYELLVIALLA